MSEHKLEIDRYSVGGVGLGECEVNLDPDGDYVDVEDVEKLFASNQALIEELRDGLDDMVKFSYKTGCDCDDCLMSIVMEMRKMAKALIQRAKKS